MQSYHRGDKSYARNLSCDTFNCLAAWFDSLSRSRRLYSPATNRRCNGARHAFCERPNCGVTEHSTRLAPLVMAALILSVAATAADFSGAWKMDPSRSESAHQAVPIGPVTLLIKQTPEEITIETRRATNREILTYKLDGSETTTNGITCRSRSDDPKLILGTTRNVQDSTITTLQRHTLDPTSRHLTIATTLTTN